jgi:uncharacterized repeat protein (TIGR03803 family)
LAAAQNRKAGSVEKLSLPRTVGIVFAFCLAAAITSPAQTFTTLVNFDGTNGSVPEASLVQGLDGDFYGTTYFGGSTTNCHASGGCGTVFKITAAGTLTTLYNFCAQANCADGQLPSAGLFLATNGNFYGTTVSGGTNGQGTVFKITPAGALTTLYSFCAQTNCTDGSAPVAGLVQATNGSFYGTTSTGGSDGGGTVFKMTAAGTLTTLQSFDGTDGTYPVEGLVQASSGNFYGTTFNGGYNCSLLNRNVSCGTIFEITPAGKLTTLFKFEDGTTTGNYAALVQAANGIFYGTESGGGAYQDGRIFEMTPAGSLTTLYSFDYTDGGLPQVPLVRATDGNFYGTTPVGAATNYYGTVFEITATGTLTTLYSFCSQPNCTDGAYPEAALFQGTNGTFYGTTSNGETSDACTANCGTVFSVSVGLGPFIETLPTSGKVGAKIIILGNNLTGSSAVTFNSKPATFTVVSATEITATVPAGATTGTVTVTTSSGTLKSNAAFRVTE